jgi:hypothetical protein
MARKDGEDEAARVHGWDGGWVNVLRHSWFVLTRSLSARSLAQSNGRPWCCRINRAERRRMPVSVEPWDQRWFCAERVPAAARLPQGTTNRTQPPLDVPCSLVSPPYLSSPPIVRLAWNLQAVPSHVSRLVGRARERASTSTEGPQDGASHDR